MVWDGKAEIEKAKAKLAAAKLLITDEDRAYQLDRAELDRIREETDAIEREKLRVALNQRMDKARAELGDEMRLAELVIPHHKHTFIIRDPGRAAYRQWEKDIALIATGKSKAERADVARAFATKCVHDWNGITDFDAINPETKTTYGAELNTLFDAQPAIATSVQNAGVNLAGLSMEDSKS